MNSRKDEQKEVRDWAAGTARSPDHYPETERRSIEPAKDRSQDRMTAEQQRRLRDLCDRTGTEFVERLTPEEAKARIEELERILR
jgi:hypothetical protein